MERLIDFINNEAQMQGYVQYSRLEIDYQEYNDLRKDLEKLGEQIGNNDWSYNGVIYTLNNGIVSANINNSLDYKVIPLF